MVVPTGIQRTRGQEGGTMREVKRGKKGGKYEGRMKNKRKEKNKGERHTLKEIETQTLLPS